MQPGVGAPRTDHLVSALSSAPGTSCPPRTHMPCHAAPVPLSFRQTARPAFSSHVNPIHTDLEGSCRAGFLPNLPGTMHFHIYTSNIFWAYKATKWQCWPGSCLVYWAFHNVTAFSSVQSFKKKCQQLFFPKKHEILKLTGQKLFQSEKKHRF